MLVMFLMAATLEFPPFQHVFANMTGRADEFMFSDADERFARRSFTGSPARSLVLN